MQSYVIQEGVFLTKINWKKWLPTLLAIAGVIFLVGAILLFAIAVPKADQTYKRVLSIICAVLMLILAGLSGVYLWLSRDTYPNYFLYDRKKKKNIPVEKLKFNIVSERMTFLLGQIAESPEAIWKSDVLLHEDETYGYRSVYKPLVAYKLLYDLGEQGSDTSYWGYFRSAPEVNINALCEALERVGEKKMVEAFRMILARDPGDNTKIKEFLRKNLGYIRSKMMSYVVKHIELFY